jgi:mono/diheme cytochrome c family protein
MKRTLSLAACLIAFGVIALTQEDADYQKWMKTTAATAGSLRKNLEAKNGDGAASDAKKLQEVFQQVHDFWQKKGVDDATKFAMDAGSGFKEVSELASAGKFDDASAALKKTMSNCAGCHGAHRDKAPDGSFKIK